MFPVAYMTVRHGVHISLIALLLIVLIVFLQNKQAHFRFEGLRFLLPAIPSLWHGNVSQLLN
jgi:uncharacterized integral membrane protein